ncbi:MAG: pantetheine-phosphate adenylyltransferase [Actinomycetota bacterium]|jgi:pantetheine-phosphate adenylyltransferase
MQKVVCPGSFDPVTNGHIDVFKRAADLAQEVVVAVLVNHSKNGLFSIEERVELIKDSVKHLNNVAVATFDGLLVDFCKDNGVTAIVKGLRAVSDFDYELQMSQMNYQLGEIETLFVATNPLYSFLSSSLVREVARHGGEIGNLVPQKVQEELRKKYKK